MPFWIGCLFASQVLNASDSIQFQIFHYISYSGCIPCPWKNDGRKKEKKRSIQFPHWQSHGHNHSRHLIQSSQFYRIISIRFCVPGGKNYHINHPAFNPHKTSSDHHITKKRNSGFLKWGYPFHHLQFDHLKVLIVKQHETTMVTWGFRKPNPFQASHPESPTPGASSCRERLRAQTPTTPGRLWSRGSWAPTKRRPWRSCGGSRRAWTWAWPLTHRCALWFGDDLMKILQWKSWDLDGHGKKRWIIMIALGKWWTWP